MENYFVYASVFWVVEAGRSGKHEESLEDQCLNLHKLQWKQDFILACKIDSISWCHFLACLPLNLQPMFLSPVTEAYHKHSFFLSFPASLI